MKRFTGDLGALWRPPDRPPLSRLTWWWWWWLVMLEPRPGEAAGRQLTLLWSTKEAPSVAVRGVHWEGGVRPGVHKDHLTMPGMVGGWWWDGQRMVEPAILRSATLAVFGDTDPSPGGAVVALDGGTADMGLSPEGDRFWLAADLGEGGGPTEVRLSIEPWTPVTSVLRPATRAYPGGMGYEIHCLHGATASGRIEGEQVRGTAYLQRVLVQAPTVPWYWGLIHGENGLYLDWFVPHLGPIATRRHSRPWPRRTRPFAELFVAALLHDPRRGRTEHLTRVNLDWGIGPERDHDGTPLPALRLLASNGRTEVSLAASAVSRAHWTFDQPTRAGMVSHLTYNEYPLHVHELSVRDEQGMRTNEDFGWLAGNAEHSWGLLH